MVCKNLFDFGKPWIKWKHIIHVYRFSGDEVNMFLVLYFAARGV